MSMKMMNAAYLVDNAALLSLQEKQDGVEFHCFDMDSKVQTTEIYTLSLHDALPISVICFPSV